MTGLRDLYSQKGGESNPRRCFKRAPHHRTTRPVEPGSASHQASSVSGTRQQRTPTPTDTGRAFESLSLRSVRRLLQAFDLALLATQRTPRTRRHLTRAVRPLAHLSRIEGRTVLI